MTAVVGGSNALLALEKAVGGAECLHAVDDAIIDYLVLALADSSAFEEDVIEVVQPFLSEISADISFESAEEIARSLRRELHGEPDQEEARDKPVRLARATRLGAGIGIEGARRRAGKSRGGGNANQTLDRTAEAENAKEQAEKRRARRAGVQPKTYQSRASVGSMKSSYVAGSTDVHVEGVDLAFGGLSLLESADLHIPYGRRIGLVRSRERCSPLSTPLGQLVQKSLFFPFLSVSDSVLC